MKPHKHAELIKAWANGAQIQLKRYEAWVDLEEPLWTEDNEYRIKPTMPKREWVGLTDEELNEHARWADEHGGTFYIAYARSIEAKLKEKNT